MEHTGGFKKVASAPAGHLEVLRAVGELRDRGLRAPGTDGGVTFMQAALRNCIVRLEITATFSGSLNGKHQCFQGKLQTQRSIENS